MTWELIKKSKYIIITHVAIILAVLGCAELFGKADASLWVMMISLGLLLICYFMFRAAQLKYIPMFDVFIALCNVLLWFVLGITSEYWSNITGWDGLVHVIYPIYSVIFAICLLVMNLFVLVIKWVKSKIKRI